MKPFIYSIISILIFCRFVIAQDFAGIKICLNPGHGGHDSNDRYIAATGFWESDGNLAKGLFLRDILQAFHADVIMTRVTNNSSDDLPLSQIVAIANSNNVDYFHSIHSNAYDGKTNYTLLLFQGGDNSPTYPGSLVMGNYISNEIYNAHRTTGKYNRGDFDFYGTGKAYLGVFKGLNMPGTLSEGSFHDYIPESFRLMNQAYKKHEAWAIAKAFISYFNLQQITTGMVAGIVRDPEQTVDYPAITSKHDNIKPVNNIKVILEPGDKIYNGDSNNNGFFMFDSLAPGQYKLIYECENYIKDSSVVTVEANKTVFADKNLLYDTTIAPQIIAHSPQNTSDSISAGTSIQITFDRTMNKESVENAFSISPNASGKFTWGNSDKSVTFVPLIPLEKSTDYKVTISTNAKSKWLVSIPADYTFNFTTKNRNRLLLLDTYPKNSQTGLSTTLQIRLTFDAPVNSGSLTHQISLNNSSGTAIPVTRVKVFSGDNKGYIYFEPGERLSTDENYKIFIGGAIADYNNISLVDSTVINFKTSSEENNFGAVLNDFELSEGWKLNVEGDTKPNAAFKITSYNTVHGSKAGQLDYRFNSEAGGEISLSNSKEINFGPENDIKLGLWIFGDLSNNKIYCSLSSDSLLNQNTFVDSLNWTGWKLVKIQVPSINLNVDKLYYKLSIVQNNIGPAGTLYLDDFQYLTPTTGIENAVSQIKSYKLYQNYPNPFNPSTIIRYQVPERSFVTLKVYDILGRLVAILVNEEKDYGIYSIEFSASDIDKNIKNLYASGVYFYTLKAGEFISTKKLILLK